MKQEREESGKEDAHSKESRLKNKKPDKNDMARFNELLDMTKGRSFGPKLNQK